MIKDRNQISTTGATKVAFVIPTLFNRPYLVQQCVESIVANMENFRVEYSITIVVNETSQEFDDHDFNFPVIKKTSHLAFNIAKALNTGVADQHQSDFFCYVDEGVTFKDKNWLDKAIQIFSENPSIGLIGCRSHSTFKKYRKLFSTNPLIYEVLWADGLLLTPMRNYQIVGGFDETFFADCELQDFGYKLHKAGFRNLFWDGLISHVLIDFKVKHKNKKKLLELRDASRKAFKVRWQEFENKLGTVIEGVAPVGPIYLINLKDNPQRLERSKAAFEKLGLIFHRIEGVNGWKLSKAQLEQAYDNLACEKYGRHSLVPAEIGCYLSHIEAWRSIAEGQAPIGFVFEDDFAAEDDLPNVLSSLSNDLGPWEIVKLFSLNNNPRTLMRRQLGDRHELVLPYKVPTCNTAYAIRRETAARLVHKTQRFFRAVDEDFKFYWEKKLKIGLVLPAPVRLGDQQASTGTIGDARRKNQSSRSLLQTIKGIRYQLRYKLLLGWNRLIERTKRRFKV